MVGWSCRRVYSLLFLHLHFGVFDKRLKFPQLFTAYLGILTVWLQTYTPKIRVNTYHHLSDFDFFFLGIQILRQASWMTFWLHLDLHESENDLPGSLPPFFFGKFLRWKPKTAEIMASFRVCVDDIVEVAGLDHGCLAGNKSLITCRISHWIPQCFGLGPSYIF